MLFGVKIPEARLQTCDGMPTRIVERLHHLDQVYPEWKLPEGTYCMEWEGNSAFWTFRGTQEVFYSEPMLWEGELSAALAKGLCSLGRKVRQETQEKRNSFYKTIACGAVFTVLIVALSGMQGVDHWIFKTEL